MNDYCNYCGDDEDTVLNNLCKECANKLAELGAL